MNHTLTAKGAAFAGVEGDLGVIRVDPTGTGGIGKALCSCGWLSDDLPSGKQRMMAHKAHKEDPEADQERQDDPLQEGEEMVEAKPVNAEKDEENVLADSQAAEEYLAENPLEDSEEAPEQDAAHRDYLGNYAIEMVPFTATLAAAVGLEVRQELFKGELRRRAHITGDKDRMDAFLPVLDALAAQVMVDLKTWQKEHRAERRGQTDQQLYVANRAFIRDFAERSAKEL